MNISPVSNFSFTSSISRVLDPWNFRKQPEWHERQQIKMQSTDELTAKNKTQNMQIEKTIKAQDEKIKKTPLDKAENLRLGAEIFYETANKKFVEFDEFVNSKQRIKFHNNGVVAMEAVVCDDYDFDRIVIKYDKNGNEVSRAKVKKTDETYKLVLIEENPLSTEKNIYEFVNGNVEHVLIGVIHNKTDLVFGYSDSGFPLFAIGALSTRADGGVVYDFKCDFKNNKPFSARQLRVDSFTYNIAQPLYANYYF